MRRSWYGLMMALALGVLGLEAAWAGSPMDAFIVPADRATVGNGCTDADQDLFAARRRVERDDQVHPVANTALNQSEPVGQSNDEPRVLPDPFDGAPSATECHLLCTPRHDGLQWVPLERSVFLSGRVFSPRYGPLADLLETGYGGGIDLFLPLRPAVVVDDQSAWLLGAEMGFDYTYFEAKRGVNLNRINGANHIVHNADLYRFSLGPALYRAGRLGYGDVVTIVGAGLKGYLGGVAADIKANNFDPADRHIVVHRPEEQAFVWGGRCELSGGLMLGNGAIVRGYGGFDALRSDAFIGDDRGSGGWAYGVQFEFAP